MGLTDAQAAVARVTFAQALRLAGLEMADYLANPKATGWELRMKNLPNPARLARQYGVAPSTMWEAVRGRAHNPAARKPRRPSQRDWFDALLIASREMHDAATMSPQGVVVPLTEWFAFSLACYADEVGLDEGTQ